MTDLYALWQLSFPNHPSPNPLNHENWKLLGFQSDDPLRDFRGSGIFGLHNLLFFAHKYPRTWEKMADLNHRRGERFPFTVASFNVTMMLFELLGWGWKTPGQSTCRNPVHHFLIHQQRVGPLVGEAKEGGSLIRCWFLGCRIFVREGCNVNLMNEPIGNLF
eukprot:TRINITY_DN3565_c0_g1_i15.p1 TRINITY_DN3565_c0_g1~~TRINITY_DN3565_c0_g1_i15.p1  ORF type:complete len:162 (-),score=24.15 TRINITY_DN3565_c0_g1_i15:1227-1712(-)